MDFLSSQSNMLAASKQFQKLKELVMGPNTDVKQFLKDYGAFESVRKRMQDKQR